MAFRSRSGTGCLALALLSLVGAACSCSGSGGSAASGGHGGDSQPAGTGGRAAGGGRGGSSVGGSGTGGRGDLGGHASTGGQGPVGGQIATGGNSATGGAQGGAGSGGASAGRGGGGVTGASGGRGGGGGGWGSEGGATFSPCPSTGAPCAVMPLGDSITDGFGTPGGYRIELFRKTLMNSKHMTFVGRRLNGPSTVSVGGTTTPFPQGNEGYSGFTIYPISGRSGISDQVDGAFAAATPHIVLLMAGTNDIDLDADVANAPKRLGSLIDTIVAKVPQALLVVAKITPLNYDAGNARVRAYDDAIPALVQSRVAAGKHILLVDMYAPFTANPSFKTELLADQWHPNPEGYLAMSQVWYDAIQSYLR